jgi:outer membrane protein W
MRIRSAILLFILVVSGVSALGQEKYFYVALDVNKPLSNTSWISSTSTRGMKIGYRGFINDRFSAGVDISSGTFEEYVPTETRQTGNGAITTDYFNYIYSLSAVISGQYNFYLKDDQMVFPYVGIGVGANNNEYVVYYNIYTDSERRWGFLLRPEAGVLVKIGKRGSFGAMAAIHYDYATNKSENFGYNHFNTVGFQVGVVMIDL